MHADADADAGTDTDAYTDTGTYTYVDTYTNSDTNADSHTLMRVRMQAQMQFPPCPMPPRSYHAKSDGADGSDASDASDAYDAEGFGRIRNLVRILKFTN